MSAFKQQRRYLKYRLLSFTEMIHLCKTALGFLATHSEVAPRLCYRRNSLVELFHSELSNQSSDNGGKDKNNYSGSQDKLNIWVITIGLGPVPTSLPPPPIQNPLICTLLAGRDGKCQVPKCLAISFQDAFLSF